MARRLALVFLLAACEPPTPVHRASDALQTCATSRGPIDGINGAIERINALPMPVSAACLVATVPRPLAVVATTGIMSAQPAVDRASPRIFLMLDALALGVVPSGDGAKLLEFGQWVTPTRTLKGELAVPVDAPLASDAAFRHVLFSQPATTCALCHRAEAPHDGLPGAYVSTAYQPESRSLVSVKELSALHDECTASTDPSPRCELFHALFDFGIITQGAFAPQVETFIQ
jgi:hypothetical protein